MALCTVEMLGSLEFGVDQGPDLAAREWTFGETDLPISRQLRAVKFVIHAYRNYRRTEWQLAISFAGSMVRSTESFP